MIAGIKKAFITNLPHVEWMDEETKGKALKKVQVTTDFEILIIVKEMIWAWVFIHHWKKLDSLFTYDLNRVILLNDGIEKSKKRVQLKNHVYFWKVCDNHTQFSKQPKRAARDRASESRSCHRRTPVSFHAQLLRELGACSQATKRPKRQTRSRKTFLWSANWKR